MFTQDDERGQDREFSPLKDKYAWLENSDNPRVIKWAQKQDKATRARVREYSDVLFKRMLPYYRRPVMRSVQLTKRGIILFYSDHKSYKVQLLHDDGERETLADSARLGKDTVIQGAQAREDGTRLALYYSQGGSDEGTVSILDLETGRVVDELGGFIGDLLWLDDDSYYYVRTSRKEKSPDGIQAPTDRIYLRKNGKDDLVFGRGLPTNSFIEIFSSHDSSRSLVNVYHGFSVCRPYAGSTKHPESWVPLYPETNTVVSNVDYAHGRHILLSFMKNCGELLSTNGKSTRTLVRETEWPLLEAAVVGDDVLCHYLVNASSELHLYSMSGRPRKRFKFKIAGSLIGNRTISAHHDEAAVTFSSFTLPFRIYKIKKGRLRTVLSEELPGKYRVSEGYARSPDGTRVHYFLTGRTGVHPRKILLFGYGGFRVSTTPSFNPTYLPFLEDGGTFAAANLRGGLEHGEKWHLAGVREKKFRVFQDYLAVLAKLKHDGGRVVGYGRSNGGLLMGATMNEKPELFDGVLIGYPVLDMMVFHRLLIGRAWVPEYGDPENAKDRKFLLKYSPYQNISSGKHYPPVFIYSGLKDDRVHPAHAFKYFAKLKDLGADVSLRVESESGHIGTTPFAKIREEADKMAFVYGKLGLTLQKPGSRARTD